MLGKILFCVIAIIVYCEATYLGGYSGKYGLGGVGYGNLGLGYNGLGLGAGRVAYAYGTPGLQYTVGAVKTPYNYPSDIDSAYGLYYDGYGSNYGSSYGSNYGALYSSPQKYAYGSNLGYYGNYGFPLKK